MTLSSTISGANLTKIRANKYRAQQFVAPVPDVVVVQFQPSAAPALSVYAEIAVGSIASGSMSNVKSQQTVIYSTTADYHETEVYKNYVRKVSGTSALYVGETGQNLTTSHYVTVLNTYDVFNKPRVERNDVQYADWDIAFRRLLPVESDLPTAVVLINGETSWSPTSNPVAMDNDASSSFTHAWESSNSNDSLDSGGTTNNPSWTLQANAHRWIRYTFTDSNGNANLRVISVWTVPKNLASVINLGFVGSSNDVADISYQIGVGWSCNIPAYKDISDLRKGTFICVFSIEEYNGVTGSIESNIDFVGYLGVETTGTGGNPEYGRISETSFVVNSFGAMLATTPVQTLNVVAKASPSAWGEIENPTPMRMASYILTEHTTFLHLCAFNVPSDHTDFIASGDVFRNEYDIALDAVRYQADAMDGIIQFARDGRFDITRNLVQTDGTTRDAADTIVTMTPADWLDYSVEINPDNTIRFILFGAGVFNTTSGRFDTFQAVVPPMPDTRGVGTDERPNMVLTTNSTQANAMIEMAQRCANTYAALNPTDLLRVTLKDGWRFLQPDVGTWYKFTIAAGDTIRGFSYDSNTRWQLIDIRYSSNNETGTKEVTGTFRRETSSTGANVVVTPVPSNPANNINALPAVLPPWSGGNLGLTDGLYFDSFDTTPSTDPTPPGQGCEIVGFRPKDGIGTQTDESASLGQAISFLVRGTGILDQGGQETDDFTASANGWVSFTVGQSPFGQEITSGGTGTHSGGTGWVHGDFITTSVNYHRGVIIQLDLGSTKTVTYMKVTYNYTKGTSNSDSNNALSLRGLESDDTLVPLTGEDFGDLMNGNDQEIEYSSETGVAVQYLYAQLFATMFGNNPQTGSATITQIDFTIKTIYGDALYTWSPGQEPVAYGSGDGLLINNSQPVSIPPYNDGHEYALYDDSIGQSGPISLDFESPHNINDMEYWGIQAEVCFL